MLTFPSALRPFAGGYAPFAKTLGGGQSLSGLEQVVSVFNDRWQAAFRFSVRSTGELLALRAFVLAMRGRANTVALPAYDRSRAPWSTDSLGRDVSPATQRNRRLDGTVYADAPGLAASLIDARLGADAAVLDTTIDVAMVSGGVPIAGQYLSIGTRLYSVLSVAGAGPFTLELWPWVRVAAPAGTAVNFAAPLCEMRFQSDGEGADALKSMDQMRFATVTLNFDEAQIS